MTTNLVNGKRYIGRKTSDVFVEDYFGSGCHLKRALNKYGKENFKVELIEALDSKEESIEREQYWINYYNAVEDDSFYNHSPGGPNEGWEIGEGNIAKTKYCRKLNSEKHTGKTYSKETEEKRVNTQMNKFGVKRAIQLDEFKEKRKQTSLERFGVDNYSKTEEFKQAQSERTREYNLTKKDYTIVAQKNTGKKFMNKDGVQKWVNAVDIEQHILDGWTFGACKKRNRDYSHPWNKEMKMSDKNVKLNG